MVGQANHFPQAAHLRYRVFGRLAGFFVDDAENGVQRFAPSLGQGPAGQLFGDRIHEGHQAVHVAGDDGVADGFKSGLEPLLAVDELLRASGDLGDPAQIAGGNGADMVTGKEAPGWRRR